MGSQASSQMPLKCENQMLTIVFKSFNGEFFIDLIFLSLNFDCPKSLKTGLKRYWNNWRISKNPFHTKEGTFCASKF